MRLSLQHEPAGSGISSTCHTSNKPNFLLLYYTMNREEEPMDLLPPHPVEPLRRLLQWDFCHVHPEDGGRGTQSPPAPAPSTPPRMRSVTVESHLSVGSPTSSSSGAADPLETLIHNAQKAWDNFVQPHLPQDVPREVSTAASSTSTESDKQPTEEKQEETVTYNVVVTEPATSRAVRVYRGLELFLLTILILVMTLYALSRSGIEMDFVLERKYDL